MSWTHSIPVVQESCCCGAQIVPKSSYEPTTTKRLEQFRAAHAVCREAWAAAHREAQGAPPVSKRSSQSDESEAA